MLSQGRFTGKPGEIAMRARQREAVHSVEIGREVSIMGEGRLYELPT